LELEAFPTKRKAEQFEGQYTLWLQSRGEVEGEDRLVPV
jgi:hypothetical protein